MPFQITALIYITSFYYSELLLMGGMSAKDQVDALYRGVDIVVGTPGRLEDLISTGKMELSACRFFVLDECVSQDRNFYTLVF